MPKDVTAKQFRKGTKSCVECRQRKLRCIPSADESQPCQNCATKGRHCVLQVHAGRSLDVAIPTSRERIRKLEDNVGKLWNMVKDLRTELGHANVDPSPDTELQHDRMEEDDEAAGSESESSDMSPINRPAHLQALFDNELLDTHGGGMSTTPESGGDKAMTAVMQKARKQLNALLPPRDDFIKLAHATVRWFAMYSELFPLYSPLKGGDDMISRFEELAGADADPWAVAGVLLWMAISLQHSAPDAFTLHSDLFKDRSRYVRKVADTIEECILMEDALAACIMGIEIGLLWIRIKLSSTNTRKNWLMLRRCIAIAELLGLPRVKEGPKAALWESISIVDRLTGLMFSTPAGTAWLDRPDRQEVTVLGKVDFKAYLNHLARISAAVNDLDNAYSWDLPEHEIFDKVFRIDQDLRSLRASTPEAWWSLSIEQRTAALLLQFWHHYLTVRAHLQLALRNSSQSECMYSFLTCTKACRDLAERYVRLRSALPVAFFAGRMIDLEAMTPAVFLMYTSHRHNNKTVMPMPDNNEESARDVAFSIVHMFDSVCAQSNEYSGTDVARKAAKAVRSLDQLLNESSPPESQTLSLRIPMLGRLNISRHPKPADNNAAQSYQIQNMDPTAYSDANGAPMSLNHTGMQGQAYPTGGVGAIDPWTMDLFIGDSMPLVGGDEFLANDSWYSFTNNV